MLGGQRRLGETWGVPHFPTPREATVVGGEGNPVLRVTRERIMKVADWPSWCGLGVLLALGYGAVATAADVSSATSTTYCSTTPGTTDKMGPIATGGEGVGMRSLADSVPGLNFTFEAQVYAHVITGLDPPTVDAYASYNDNGWGQHYGTHVGAQASGEVKFYFRLQKVGPSPPWEPRLLPVTFHAMGEGSARSGPHPGVTNVSFHVQAILYVDGFPSEDFAAAGNRQGGFDARVLLWLAENTDYNPEYSGYLWATCGGTSQATYWVNAIDPDNLAVINDPDSGEATAMVDPELYLDQAAFDAAHGPESFPLEDYYTIEFSENLSRGGTEPIRFIDARVNAAGQTELTFSGSAGDVCRIMASTNLVDWRVIDVVRNSTGTAKFTDLTSTNYIGRFYRVAKP